MSIGTSLLSLMGTQDPRQRMVERILAAQQPVSSAPYAAPQQDPAAMQVAGAEPEGGEYATQASKDAAAKAPPPQQAEAYTSPADLSGMYKEILEYNSRAENFDRGFALLGSAFAHPENRANIINTFSPGDSSAQMDPAKMVELAQGIQKSQIERATLAAQMARLPAIAEKYGIDLPTAQLLLQSGQLDEFVGEREKLNNKNNELVPRVVDGQTVFFKGDKITNTYGTKKMPDLEFREINGQVIGIDKSTGKEVSRIGEKQVQWEKIEDTDGTTMIIDKNNPTKVLGRLGTPKDPLATDDTREYDRYRADLPPGSAPMSFEDWQTKMKKAGANNTNVTVGGEKKFQEKMGEEQAKRYVGFQTAADSARKSKEQYALAEKALDSGLETGTGADMMLAARKAGQFLGVDVDEGKIAAAETMKAAANQMAMIKRNPESGLGLPGSVSDRDLQFLKDADFNLGTSEAGNRVLIKVARKIAERNEEVASMAAEYVEKNGNLDAGFEKQLRDYAKANPLFDDIDFKTQTPEEKRKAALDKWVKQ